MAEPWKSLSLGWEQFFANLPDFDMRSGSVSDAAPLVGWHPVPERFWWVPIENMPAQTAAQHPDAYIRSAYAQLKKEFSGTDSERRLRAIILGIARSVMTSSYALETTDFKIGQVAKPVYKFIPAGTGSSSDMIVVDSQADPAKAADAQGMPDFTDAERAIMVTLKTVSVAIPALQGLSLITAQHHFVDWKDNQARRAFTAIEKQFFREGKKKTWLSSNRDIFQDTAWHKSGHPIRVDVKMALAKSKRVPEMLKEAGLSYVAAHLPVKENALKRAETYRTLCATVAPFIEAYGGSLNYTLLTQVTDYADSFPTDGSTPPNFQLPTGVPSTWGGEQANRPNVMNLLEKFLDKNMGIAAQAYGFYTGLINDNALAKDSLKWARCLQKLPNQHLGYYYLGLEDYKDYCAFKNRQSKCAAKEASVSRLPLDTRPHSETVKPPVVRHIVIGLSPPQRSSSSK